MLSKPKKVKAKESKVSQVEVDLLSPRLQQSAMKKSATSSLRENLLKGETFRRRLKIPLWDVKV